MRVAPTFASTVSGALPIASPKLTSRPPGTESTVTVAVRGRTFTQSLAVAPALFSTSAQSSI